MAVIAAARTPSVMELRPGLKDVRRPAELMHAYITLSLLTGIRTEEAFVSLLSHRGVSIEEIAGWPGTPPPAPPKWCTAGNCGR